MSTPVLVDMLNNGRRACEEMASAHASITAASQSMGLKLLQIPKNATNTAVGRFIVMKTLTRLSSEIVILASRYCSSKYDLSLKPVRINCC